MTQEYSLKTDKEIGSRIAEKFNIKKLADDDEGGVWRTVKGRKIFIKEGEDIGDAMKSAFGKGEGGARKNNTFNLIPKADSPKIVDVSEKYTYGVQKGKKYLGKCFDQAGRWMLDNGNDVKDSKLVHGNVLLYKAVPIAHSWIEFNYEGQDVVFDGTQQEFYDKKDYYKITSAEKEQEYNSKQTMKAMLKYKHYGPWEQPKGMINSGKPWKKTLSEKDDAEKQTSKSDVPISEEDLLKAEQILEKEEPPMHIVKDKQFSIEKRNGQLCSVERCVRCAIAKTLGGEGSGHFDHEGRPGEVGGSTPGGGGGFQTEGILKGYSLGAGVDANNVIHTNNVDDAVKALEENKKVNLKQPKQVSSMLKEIQLRTIEAEKLGKKAPIYNLCNATVEGSNIFCSQNKGIYRINMPQLKGVPLKDSLASKLTPDIRGEVDVTEKFVESLKSSGYKVSSGTERADYLRATQRELNGAKVAGIADALRSGKLVDTTIIVSGDNYIIDGHHRWAATVAVDYDDNHPGDLRMPIAKVDIDVIDLLAEARAYSSNQGIPQTGVS